MIKELTYNDYITVKKYGEYQLYFSESYIDTDEKRQYGGNIKVDLLYNKVMDLIISKAPI